jgi:hypothetical protein
MVSITSKCIPPMFIKTQISFYSYFFAVVWTAFQISGCTKEKGNNPVNPKNEGKYTFVSNLNGYKFEGSFVEPEEPTLYTHVSLNHVEEINDGLRVVFSSHDFQTNNFKWFPKELKNGTEIAEFIPQQGYNLSPDKYEFAFSGSELKLYGYEKATSNIMTFLPDGSKSPYYLSKPNNNFPYKFNENYTVFWGNASAVYIHENLSHTYTPPAPSLAFYLTSEPSVAWADYLLDDDIVNPYEFRENIYTAFFNATYDRGNYVGIAQGSQTLDTVVINTLDPNLYYSGNPQVFISREGSKLFLGLAKIRTQYSTRDLSVYEMDINEKILRPVFTNVDAPNENLQVFQRGKFYFGTKVLNSSGELEEISLPQLAKGASVTRVVYGANKIILVVQADVDRIELYSKTY